MIKICIVLSTLLLQTTAAQSAAYFKIYKRETGVDQTRWLQSAQAHLVYTRTYSPLALTYSLNENYLVEFSAWAPQQTEPLDPFFEISSRLIFSKLK